MERETLITRWIDGDMDAAERAAFQAEMEKDATLKGEVEMLSGVGDALRETLPAEQEPPFPDFFNSQVAKKIRDGVPAAAGTQREAARPFLKLPWLVAAAACVVAVFSVTRSPVHQQGRIVGTYVPDPDVRADVRFDAGSGATIIMLEGLEEIPAEREVKPYSVASHGAGGAGEKTVFYAKNAPGKPLFVMLGNGRGNPAIYELD